MKQNRQILKIQSIFSTIGKIIYTLRKRLMKKIFSLIFATLLVLSLAPTTPVKAASDDKEFRVGMEAGYPPFNWTQKTNADGAVKIDGTNQYANGYDVQISKKIADKLDKKLVIVKTKWDGLLPALTSGKIDAIIAGMSPTAERKQAIDFSQNYYTSQLVVMVKKDGKYANAKSIDDFKGAKITGQQGVFHYDLNKVSRKKGVEGQTKRATFPLRSISTSCLVPSSQGLSSGLLCCV